MMGLSVGPKSFRIRLAVLIQYRSVTDTQPPSHVAVAITLNAQASSLINGGILTDANSVRGRIVSIIDGGWSGSGRRRPCVEWEACQLADCTQCFYVVTNVGQATDLSRPRPRAAAILHPPWHAGHTCVRAFSVYLFIHSVVSLMKTFITQWLKNVQCIKNVVGNKCL